MSSITIKNLPDPLYRILEQRAKNRHRSLNSEIIATLEETLRNHDRRNVNEMLEELERFGAGMKRIPAGEIEELRRLKAQAAIGCHTGRRERRYER